jgi:hypothetical protein
MFSADPASPTGYVSKCRVTQNQVCMKPVMLQLLVLARSIRPTLGHSTLPHGHGRAHTCGMEICEPTAVALIAAPPPPPQPLRRAQASTPARLA